MKISSRNLEETTRSQSRKIVEKLEKILSTILKKEKNYTKLINNLKKKKM